MLAADGRIVENDLVVVGAPDSDLGPGDRHLDPLATRHSYVDALDRRRRLGLGLGSRSGRRGLVAERDPNLAQLDDVAGLQRMPCRAELRSIDKYSVPAAGVVDRIPFAFATDDRVLAAHGRIRDRQTVVRRLADLQLGVRKRHLHDVAVGQDDPEHCHGLARLRTRHRERSAIRDTELL